MSDIAIRVENLSKAYRIGLKEQRHERLVRLVRQPCLFELRRVKSLRYEPCGN